MMLEVVKMVSQCSEALSVVEGTAKVRHMDSEAQYPAFARKKTSSG